MAATRYVKVEYAKPLPWYHRRAVRSVMLVLVVLGLSPLVVRLAQFGEARLQVHRLYAACANLMASPASPVPVYDEDPTTYVALAKRPEYSTVGSLNGPAAFLVQPKWKEFCAAAGAGQIQSYGTLFVGELRTPGGTRRLVGVDVTGWFRGGPSPVLSTHVRTFEPTPAMQLPPQRSGNTINVALGKSEGILRVFAGRRDPSDASHFTIDFTVGGRAGTVDGWLKEDGTMLLEPRDEVMVTSTPAPAAARAPSPPSPALSR